VASVTDSSSKVSRKSWTFMTCVLISKWWTTLHLEICGHVYLLSSSGERSLASCNSSIRSRCRNHDEALDDITYETKADQSVAKSRSRRWTSASSTVENLRSTTKDLQSRSACPWTYSHNNDPTRRPRSLIQAECIFTTVPGTTMQCEHVYSFIPVKVSDSNTGEMRAKWLKLKVGCTLATPPVFNQPPITIN